ncbi:hypothetical protein [Chondromyces apiculatus]|nr:hypothetical protein [Chondromyces apiculatus]
MTATLTTFTMASASAQETTPSPSVTRPALEMLFNTGLEAAKQENWEKAYESFSAAWRVDQHPRVALQLGRAALMTSRFVEAADRFAFFLRNTKAEISSSDRALVQKMLMDAEKHAAKLIIKVNRPDAEVLVDGLLVGQSPLTREIYVMPGPHTMEARLGTERAESVTLELKAGESRQVGLAFGAQKSRDTQVPVPRKQTLKEEPGTIFGDPDSRILIAGGVATGAGLVSGIVFTVLANAAAHELDEVAGGGDEPVEQWKKCVAGNGDFVFCDKANSIIPRMELRENVALWSFVGSGVVGIATLTYALLAPRKQPADSAAVLVPVLTPGGGGLSVVGHW